MTEHEKIEKLCEKANVTHEEARAALESCNGDLLDAVLLLEKQGKVNSASAHHSTLSEDAAESAEEDKARFSERASSFWEQVRKLIHIGNTNMLVISRNGRQSLRVPVTVLVVLVLFGHLWTLAVLALGLFFGVRYSIEGEQLGKPMVNDVMDKAANAAENVRETVEDTFRNGGN